MSSGWAKPPSGLSAQGRCLCTLRQRISVHPHALQRPRGLLATRNEAKDSSLPTRCDLKIRHIHDGVW